MVLSRLLSALDKLFLYFIGTALAGVVFICLMQVVARYAFSASFSWAEEISVTLVLWSVWVGASLCIKSNSHLRLSFLEKKLRPNTRVLLRFLMKTLIVLFAGTITYASRIVIQVNENITLMSLPVTVNIMYWSVPFGCLLMIFYCLRSMLNDYQEIRSLSTED